MAETEKLIGTGAKIIDANEWQLSFLMGKSIKGYLKSKGWKATTRIAVYERNGDIVIRRL